VFHELRGVLWLDTPKGLALAKFIIDRGIDSDLEWVTVLNETGQVLSFDNSEVIVCKSFTLGRRVEWTDFKYKAKKRPRIRTGTPNSMRRLLRKV